MAHRDFEKLVVQVRLDTRQKALQQSLLVPWRRLEESAAEYADWHIFGLWVRTIAEGEERLPEIVRSSLRARCPGFLERETGWRGRALNDPQLIWHALEEWIASHVFAEAKGQGWFDAVMYYAYKDLRVEQAWSLWERTNDARSPKAPSSWPTLQEWTEQVSNIYSRTQPAGENARALEALAKVEPDRLRRAVWDSLESRALALWMVFNYQPEASLEDLALDELQRRCPGFLGPSGDRPLWDRSLFYRLIRFAEAGWRVSAHSEGWRAALRYQVRNHPRYHRLIHYVQHCHDEWVHVLPRSSSSFDEWLRTADEYFVERTA